MEVFFYGIYIFSFTNDLISRNFINCLSSREKGKVYCLSHVILLHILSFKCTLKNFVSFFNLLTICLGFSIVSPFAMYTSKVTYTCCCWNASTCKKPNSFMKTKLKQWYC